MAKQSKPIRTKAKSRNEEIRNLIKELKILPDDPTKSIEDILKAVTDAQKIIETSKLDRREVSEKSSLLYSYLERARIKIYQYSTKILHNSQVEAKVLTSVQRHTSSPLASPPGLRARGVSVKTSSPQSQPPAPLSPTGLRERGVSMKTPIPETKTTVTSEFQLKKH